MFGLPCRHQFSILLKIGQDKADILRDACIHSHWILASTNATLNSQLPVSNQLQTSNKLSKTEMKTNINALTKTLTGLALDNPVNYNKIVKVLQDCVVDVANSRDTSSTSVNASTTIVANPAVQTKGRQTRHQGNHPSAPGTKADKRRGKAAAKNREANKKAFNKSVTGL